MQTRCESPHLVAMFTFYFFLGVVPFRIEFDKKGQNYVLKEHVVQKAFCAISNTGLISLQVYILYCQLLSIIYVISTHNQQAILVNVFEGLSNVYSIVLSLTYVFILWKRKNEYLHLLQSTCVTYSTQDVKIIQWKIYIFLTLVTILYMVIPMNFLTGNEATVLEKSPSQIFWVMLPYLPFYYLFSMFTMPVVMLAGLFVTFRRLAIQFQKNIDNLFRSDGKYSITIITEGICMCQKIKETTNLFRATFGNFLTACYALFIVYLVELPYIIFTENRPWWEKSAILVYTSSGVYWIVAAEFHYIFQNAVRNWAKCHIADPTLPVKYRIKLGSMCCSLDGVVISSKYLSLTYKNIGTMCGIIVIQLNQ